MCIKDICYNMYYCLYETFHSLNGNGNSSDNNNNKSVQRKVLFVDEEKGLIYYNKLPSNYEYDYNHNCNVPVGSGSVDF